MVMVTPNFSSAMAGFGLIYPPYLLILVLEVWFVYRQEIIAHARRSRGVKRIVLAALALGTYDRRPRPSPSTTAPHHPGRHRHPRRPASCTATSASSSARSRPTPGGPPR